MRVVSNYRLPGFVVISSGINPGIDSPTLFADISAWVKWKRRYRLVELAHVMRDDVPADALIVPRWWLIPLLLPLVVLFNLYRRHRNAVDARRQAAYFSQEGIDQRVRARQ